MSKNKKYMIEYLDIDDRLYIENDEVKIRLIEGEQPRRGSWDEMWNGVLMAIKKIRKYDEAHNKDSI